MERTDFEILVSQGLDAIPERFRGLMKNVAIIVADEPTREQARKAKLRPGTLLLGLYEGVPQTSRYGRDPLLPDKITIFQRAIESIAAGPEAIPQLVAETVWHEIVHHFGLSEHAVRQAQQKRRR